MRVRRNTFLYCLLLSLVGLLKAPTVLAEEQPLVVRWAVAPGAAQPLQSLFADFGVEKRLSYFFASNLRLPKTLQLVIVEDGEPFIDSEAASAYLPVSLFDEMKSSLNRRYPEQGEPRSAIYAAAAEQMLWQQCVKLLLSQLPVAVQGEPAFVRDNFVTVMLTNLYESEYLLDAVEEFLVVDSNKQVLSDQPFANELEFDRARYQRVACLVLGRDYQPYSEVLESLSWDAKHLELCQQRYRRALTEWVQALSENLKADAPLRQWQAHLLEDPQS